MFVIRLVFVFIYIGLFTIGGGMVAIPLIQQEVVDRGWITLSNFYQMVAVAESTPGPIGINIATFVGFDQFNILGAVVATTSFILPSFLIVSLLSKLIRKYRESDLVINWFMYLKAAIVGLIGFALINVIGYVFVDETQPFDYKALLLLIALAIMYYFLRKKPWIMIIVGGVLGAFLL